jgi:proteasome assembly chaperone 2
MVYFSHYSGLCKYIKADVHIRSIPTISLLQFVVEGDNRADANLFAVVVAKVLAADKLIPEWEQPTSWTQGLFGTVHDQSLYG